MSTVMERLSSVFTFRIMKSAKFPYMASHLVRGFCVRLRTSACQPQCTNSLRLHYSAPATPALLMNTPARPPRNTTFSVYGSFIRRAVYET